ncbi:LuxR C-terminal-related transcriptional regulator [Micromonospora sp. WMMD1102]|uniref:LuxR C-terminal-related transcriptional regulator n=1 Tax=Micromonospora sp. WMMD1102 TaxID=3016105 RepID=UPI0024156C21|nr:LuxR C-terminal-related transcriptional regulator [Micromonospora sp. WMMD1102]MDG4790649.1 LuxR C-terminal-related transcriptional regulator [Micromonospora sp. WMMD1102]
MVEFSSGAIEAVGEARRIAALPGDAEDRLPELFTVLRRVTPYSAVAMHVLDPELREFATLGGHGYPESVVAFMRDPDFYQDIELIGLNRVGPPLRVRDLPVPPSEVRVWAEHLEPAGFREGAGIPLFTSDGRHLGMITLNTDDPTQPDDAARDVLGLLIPAIADAVDPMRSIVNLSRIVADAIAGVVLTRGGGVLPLPGLGEHPVLRVDSVVLAVAVAGLADGAPHTSYLCPNRTVQGLEEHVRITVLPCPSSVPAHLVAIVLASPPGDLRGLTRRELEILGLLVDGCSNQQMAHQLVITQRTIAAHVEHILRKLDSPTRTLAAVTALRLGLYVPPPLAGTKFS